MYRVLIIDPDQSELNMLSTVVSRNDCGARIVGLFSDSRLALQFLETGPADILILTIPTLASAELALLEDLRARSVNMSCIVLSSCEDVRLAQRIIPLNIDNYLQKPVEPRILLNALSSTVQKIRMSFSQGRSFPVYGATSVMQSHTPGLINHQFEQMLFNREYRQCIDYLDNLFTDPAFYTAISPAVLKNHIVELTIYTINVLRSYNIDPAKLIGDCSAMFYRIINFQDLHALHFWMRDFLSASIEALENKNLRYSPCIARVVAHIEKNFTDDISLKTIAYELNINAAYLGQLFKSETGQLFSAYLNKVRIENAQYLLLNTTLSLSEVSQQCGYTNISYFYNIFRKITGKTPSQYRKTRTK